jgi:telomere length regulation protein
VLEVIFEEWLIDSKFPDEDVNMFLKHMPQSDQKRLLHGTMKILSERYLNDLGRCESLEAAASISAAAKLITRLVGGDELRLGFLTSWLVASAGAGMGESVGIRRAAMAAYGQDRELMARILGDSLTQFGDQLYVKHAPMLQQEGVLLSHPIHLSFSPRCQDH